MTRGTGPDATAVAWARARAAGPLRIPAGTPAPEGMLRLAELGLASPLLEQPNDTARLLAAALRCCWADPLAPIWPGVTVASAPVLAVFGELTGPRHEMAHRRSAVAGLRRLDQAGWLIWDETADTIRLGPRVALWSTSDLTTLRQLWRATPGPAA